MEKYIYKILESSTELEAIFGDNIQVLSGKNNKLPVILYQLFQVGTETAKSKGELKSEYVLKLHLFSEDYKDIMAASDICKELFDFKEIVEEDEIVIDLIKFMRYSNEYQEKAEVFNRSLEFSVDVY